MILLKVCQFLCEALNLCLQVRPVHGQVIQDSAQAIDVSFHTLAKEEFILKSKMGVGENAKVVQFSYVQRQESTDSK